MPEAAPSSRTSLPISSRILIVEDNADVADAFSLLLEAKGHQVMTADSGPSALQMVKEFMPEAAFIDIGLPGMDGYELARRLRLDPRFAKLKLIALSGYASEEDKRRSIQFGFDQHLAKTG